MTRYDVARASTWGRQEPSVVAVGAGFGLVVAALPVAFGTDPVEALVAYAAALALCAVSALLPGLVRLAGCCSAGSWGSR